MSGASLFRGGGTLVLFCALLTAGCGAVEERRQAYRASESIEPLRIPAGLTAPASAEALPLPGLLSRPAADAPPFDTRPPAPANLPAESPPEPKE